jgi:hypothetical protein
MSKVITDGWQDQSIEVTDTIAAQDAKFVKYPAGTYNVSNPHPGYGIDPNILNEYGHTKYPMWVGDKIANNEAEEKALRGEAPEAAKLPEGWK